MCVYTCARTQTHSTIARRSGKREIVRRGRSARKERRVRRNKGPSAPPGTKSVIAPSVAIIKSKMFLCVYVYVYVCECVCLCVCMYVCYACVHVCM